MYGVRCMAYVNESERVIRVLTYKEIDREEWSRLVRTSATGTWFQTPEAYMLFASMQELFLPFAKAVERVNELTNERTLRGVCVGYVTREKNPIKQYFTRRAIIIGGPVIANDATSEEVETLMIAVRNQFKILDLRFKILNSPIFIETRNFNDYSRWKGAFEKAGFEYKRHLNFHVDCTDKEKMWERLSENRKRQVRHVNGDFKFKISFPFGTITSNLRFDNLSVTEQDVREWYEILSELYRKKVKTPLWPVEFFIEAYRQGIGQFMLVRHEGKIIGGSMVVRWNPNPSPSIKGRDVRGTVYEWFECGLNAQYKEQYPSVMATYAGMCYAAEEGIGRYDMMGAGVPDVPYGVRDFKAEFGGQLVEHGRFVCVREPILYKIGVLGVKMMRG